MLSLGLVNVAYGQDGTQYNEDNFFGSDVPDYLIESVNDLLETTLTLDK